MNDVVASERHQSEQRMRDVEERVRHLEERVRYLEGLGIAIRSEEFADIIHKAAGPRKLNRSFFARLFRVLAGRANGRYRHTSEHAGENSTEHLSCDSIGRDHERLLEQCKKLEEANAQLQRERDRKNELNAEAKRRYDELEHIMGGQLEKERDNTGRYAAELKEEKARCTELEERVSKFRLMLTHAPDDNVSDSAVIHTFLVLRSHIPGLVRTTWKIKVKEGTNPTELSATRRGFFDGLYAGNSIEWTCPYERLGFAVFGLLDETIFGCRPYFLQLEPDHKDLEGQLGAVEGAMWSLCPSEEGRRNLLEWRNATMKATAPLRDAGQRLYRTAQDRIWDFFQVLELRDRKAEERGKERLQKICEQAVELGLMMRSARDEIYIDMVRLAQEQPLSQWESVVDEGTAAPADSTHQNGCIAYVYNGALVKFSKEKPGEMQVLEKGEAVVYSATRKKG